MSDEKIQVRLIGEDGNAFHILSKVSKELKLAGYSKEYIEKYQKEAMSGDYDNLLRITMEYVEII